MCMYIIIINYIASGAVAVISDIKKIYSKIDALSYNSNLKFHLRSFSYGSIFVYCTYIVTCHVIVL